MTKTIKIGYLALFSLLFFCSLIGQSFFAGATVMAADVSCSERTVTPDYNCGNIAESSGKDAVKLNCQSPGDPNSTPESQKCPLTDMIIKIINILSGLVVVVVIAVMVIAGIQYSASSGDPQATAAARKRITNALLALLFYGSMYAILQWLIPGGIF